MDSDIQIQTIKSQLENMKLQIDNIEMQNNNMMMQMSPNQVGDQLLNLSIQMFNTGIQAFNIGKNKVINNINRFLQQITQISDQIKNIKKDCESLLQQQMMQQQMMQQQMMQQQMMQQQMMQQQMQNILNNYNPMIDDIIEKPEINVTFKNVSGISNIIKVKIGTTICELFYEYSTKFYGTADKQLAYLYKGQRISRRDLRSIEEVFDNDDNPIILVIDSQ